MTADEIRGVAKLLLEHLPNTLKVFGYTLLFSVPLGMVVALLKMCRFKPISWLTNIYILIMRGTPLMLQIILIRYVLPFVYIRDDISPGLKDFIGKITQSENYLFNAVLVAFTLNYAAYFAEIFRGGIESISKGQYEAAASLSLTRSQTFFRIILPQVIKRIIPASSNEVITLVKDTSLANVVTYTEITLIAKQQMQNYSSITPLFVAGIFYFVMSFVITVIFTVIEKNLDYYK